MDPLGLKWSMPRSIIVILRPEIKALLGLKFVFFLFFTSISQESVPGPPGGALGWAHCWWAGSSGPAIPRRADALPVVTLPSSGA